MDTLGAHRTGFTRTLVTSRQPGTKGVLWGAMASVVASAAAWAGPPVVTLTDTSPQGALANGLVDPLEYSGGTLFYTGAGAGFTGAVGNSRIFFDSDPTRLYIGHEIVAPLDFNWVVVYLDTRPGGVTDAMMNDQQDDARNPVSNLSLTVDDAFDPDFLPDFALVLSEFGPFLYELTPGSTPGHLNLLGNVNPSGIGSLREVEIPRQTLGLPNDVVSPVRFVVAFVSRTAYLSNESIPPYPPLQANGNPGFGDGTFGGTVGSPGLGAYNEFITNGQPCPSSLGTLTTFRNLNSNGPIGAAGNSVVTFDLGVPGDINVITLSGEYTAFDPSYRSEMRLRFTAPSGRAYTFSTSTVSAAGTRTITNGTATLGNLESGTGTWTLEVFESFDDPINPDATWSRLCIGSGRAATQPSLPTPPTIPVLTRGQNSVVTLPVTLGRFPTSTFVGTGRVRIDATAVGAGLVELRDDGVSPDATANDSTFTGTLGVPPTASAGSFTVSASLIDDQGRSATAGPFGVTVVPGCSPAATSTNVLAGAAANAPFNCESAGNTCSVLNFGSTGLIDRVFVSGLVTTNGTSPGSDLGMRLFGTDPRTGLVVAQCSRAVHRGWACYSARRVVPRGIHMGSRDGRWEQRSERDARRDLDEPVHRCGADESALGSSQHHAGRDPRERVGRGDPDGRGDARHHAGKHGGVRHRGPVEHWRVEHTRAA